MRKVFLDELPRWEGDIRYNGKIKWNECKYMYLYFVYDDIKGRFFISDVKKDEKSRTFLTIKYLDNEEYIISTNSIIKGNLKGMLKFKNEIQTEKHYKNKNLDAFIIKKEIRYRTCGKYEKKELWYYYRCNKCNHEDWKIENSVLKGIGCPVCCHNPQIVVKGINDIATTNPEMMKYFKNKNDCYKYTKSSTKSTKVKCPDCGREKDFIIRNIYRYNGISCICKDNISYPEKFVMKLFEQLNIKIKTQLSSSIFEWCDNKRYDFYFEFNNESYIVETNGLQHYKKTTWGRTLKEEIENDKLKKQLAISNGIKEENYIVLDCRKSELDWIKNKIIHTKLNKLFDLSNINWLECHEFALSNLVKYICDLKKENPNLTTGDIKKITNINSATTISKYLKQGSRVGWCNYNIEEEILKSSLKPSKKVRVIKDGKIIKDFPSITNLENNSENIFGIKFNHGGISISCSQNKLYKGYEFQYI